jgi:ribosomal protein L11 methyltransferase
VPYRIDVTTLPDPMFEALVDLGALDVEQTADGFAALMPDSVPLATVTSRVGVGDLRVSDAVGRDDGSVWRLSVRPVRVATFLIAPSGMPVPPDALILEDGPAFGTGLHPTTALCLEAIDGVLADLRIARMLDVGTGSGILALAALRRGVETAIGLDVDPVALRVAAGNARANQLASRFRPVCGSVDAVGGSWPLVTANIRAAELVQMAPLVARRVASRGTLVLSGIAHGVGADLARTYQHLGLHRIAVAERGGWTALVFRPSW